MFEIILVAGLVLSIGWVLKRSLGWLIGKRVLPAQFRGYTLGLIASLKEKENFSTNEIYLSKDGQYKIYQADGTKLPGSLKELTGSLLELGDISGVLNANEIKELKTKLEKVEKNLYDPVLTDLVLKITVARNQTPNARPKNMKIPGEFSVKIKKGHLSTLELKPKMGEVSNRYIICFCPNAAVYRGMIGIYQKLADMNNATVVCFDYPNVGNSRGSASSQSQLIDAGMKQVQRLLHKGVPAAKITLYGYSLGGAIATIVAAHCHKQKRPVSLINDRSFSSIGDTAAGFIRNPTTRKIIKAITNPFAWLLDWNLDAAAAYKKIPAHNKMLIVAKKDEIINYEVASVYKKEKGHVIKSTKDKIKQKQLFHAYKESNATHKMQDHELYNRQHAVPIDAMKDKADGVPMMEKISKFIAKQ